MDGGTGSATARKRLAAFYTPDATASSLVRWAIRTGTESVLEPSVGGGALLRAAIIHARELGSPRRLNQTLACDIDGTAVDRLRDEFRETVEFHAGDFLELDPKSYRKFEVVIANPPFIRNHSIDVFRLKYLRKLYSIYGAAGIWVYFLTHSMEFLSQGGRIASIVPRSALFTNYGEAFLRRMCSSFSTVSVYELAEKPGWDGGGLSRCPIYPNP
jgi:methylase of polypeptide subunit release factors